ncbi:collagen alpha-1(XII) chain-like isoform X1 [Pseudopipra pipra]|uniref:collagen alpha-1(XII) chain-like isoform X1 n=1 Tax=Pseudopipra pipra TaxID=415032 RepID=UPI0031394614
MISDIHGMYHSLEARAGLWGDSRAVRDGGPGARLGWGKRPGAAWYLCPDERASHTSFPAPLLLPARSNRAGRDGETPQRKPDPPKAYGEGSATAGGSPGTGAGRGPAGAGGARSGSRAAPPRYLSMARTA